jgi:hypothetical protein
MKYLKKHRIHSPYYRHMFSGVVSNQAQLETSKDHVFYFLFFLFFIFYFLPRHKLNFRLQERSQNTTNLGEAAQPKRKSRSNTHLRPILPRDN